jgi:hypothetical protein
MGWVISFTPRPRFTPGKGLPVPLDRRLGGPRSTSGHGGYRKNPMPLPGIERRNRACEIISVLSCWYNRIFLYIIFALIERYNIKTAYIPIRREIVVSQKNNT